MSPQDKQRLKNLLIYKVYATDKEMEDMAPVFVGIIVIIVLIIIGVNIWMAYR